MKSLQLTASVGGKRVANPVYLDRNNLLIY